MNEEMEESEDIASSANSYETKDLLKFLILSILGLSIFLLPIPREGIIEVPIGLIVDWLQAILGPSLPFAGMVIVTFSAVFTLYSVAFKPTFVKDSDYLRKLFIVGPVWYVSRAIGAIFYILTIWKIGPEYIWAPGTGSQIGEGLIPMLVVLFIFTSLVIALLTDYGLMEYVGTLARPLLKPLFKIPGRASIDALASWLGSPAVGVIITSDQYENGYYSGKESAIISTTFSLVSIGYIYAMVALAGIPELYLHMVISTYIVCIIIALIMPRIPPLKWKKDEYYQKSGKQIHEDKQPDGLTLHQWAIREAVNRAKDSSFVNIFRKGYKTLGKLYIGALPLVMAWATIALMIAEYTPVFDYLSYPFSMILEGLGIPEAANIAPAFVLSFPNQFLGAVVGSTVESRIASFMAAGISITGLVYLGDMGVILLSSDIPVDIKDMVIIYIFRAFFSVFLLAPFAFLFAG